MAAMPGNHHDMIKRVQELLDQEIERVNDLKNLLSIAEENVTQLKGELDEYHARITPTPINSCPSEILSMIFKLYVPEDDDDTWHKGQLLLVCKRWYTLVVNDPTMWTTINIFAPPRWGMRSWSDSTRSYLESCVERSRAMSLNIDLNFTLLQTTSEQLIERLRWGFFQLPSCTPTEDGGELIEGWLRNLYYGDLEDDVNTTFDCLPNHAIELIAKLAGMDEDIMERCESFTLWFPSAIQLCSAMWEQLAPQTINLSRLHLISLCWDKLLSSYYEDDNAVPKLSLPQVNDIRIGALYGWDRFLSFDPSSLHKLSVNTSFEKDFFSEIGRFDQLQTLTLLPSMSNKSVIMDRDLPNRVYLPVLQELVLLGYFINLDAVKFHLPRLKRLVVGWGMAFSSIQYAMPMVQPPEVHWAPVDEPDSREDTLRLADKVIRSFLLHYASSDCFSVTFFLKDNALKVLKVLSTEGLLPPKWRTVSFHDKFGSIESMQIDNIVCR
jgi:F-box-like